MNTIATTLSVSLSALDCVGSGRATKPFDGSGITRTNGPITPK
jgi:hypothetical protein